jgi:small subunit ribosomal protein S8e
MVLTQDRSKRKSTGGRFTIQRLKRRHRLGRSPVLTSVGVKKTKTTRSLGGAKKIKLRSTDKVNIMDQKTKKCSVETIKTIVENPANRHFVRRNIFNKGAVIETSKGKAKVTNRPSQDGTVNAILL